MYTLSNIHDGTFFRSRRPEVLCKKGFLKNFIRFTGKHLCQSLFFKEVVDDAYNVIKKETLSQVFSCKFCEFFKNTFFHRTAAMAASLFCDNNYRLKTVNYFFQRTWTFDRILNTPLDLLFLLQ